MHVEMLRPNEDSPRGKKKKKGSSTREIIDTDLSRQQEHWERGVWLWDNTTSLAQVG